MGGSRWIKFLIRIRIPRNYSDPATTYPNPQHCACYPDRFFVGQLKLNRKNSVYFYYSTVHTVDICNFLSVTIRLRIEIQMIGVGTFPTSSLLPSPIYISFLLFFLFHLLLPFQLCIYRSFPCSIPTTLSPVHFSTSSSPPPPSIHPSSFFPFSFVILSLPLHSPFLLPLTSPFTLLPFSLFLHYPFLLSPSPLFTLPHSISPSIHPTSFHLHLLLLLLL